MGKRFIFFYGENNLFEKTGIEEKKISGRTVVMPLTYLQY